MIGSYHSRAQRGLIHRCSLYLLVVSWTTDSQTNEMMGITRRVGPRARASIRFPSPETIYRTKDISFPSFEISSSASNAARRVRPEMAVASTCPGSIGSVTALRWDDVTPNLESCDSVAHRRAQVAGLTQRSRPA